jgi:hypothetical protein
MRPLSVLTVAAALVAGATTMAFTAATGQVTVPPLTVTVYNATPGGFQVGFWMKHSTGWKWSGTTAGANKLGCTVSGTYFGDAPPSPGAQYPFSGRVKPTVTPYHASISVSHFDNNLIAAHATCTLRRLNANHVWVYKTVTSNWNGT